MSLPDFSSMIKDRSYAQVTATPITVENTVAKLGSQNLTSQDAFWKDFNTTFEAPDLSKVNITSRAESGANIGQYRPSDGVIKNILDSTSSLPTGGSLNERYRYSPSYDLGNGGGNSDGSGNSAGSGGTDSRGASSENSDGSENSSGNSSGGNKGNRENNEDSEEKPKKSIFMWVVLFIILAIICGLTYYYWDSINIFNDDSETDLQDEEEIKTL